VSKFAGIDWRRHLDRVRPGRSPVRLFAFLCISFAAGFAIGAYGERIGESFESIERLFEQEAPREAESPRRQDFSGALRIPDARIASLISPRSEVEVRQLRAKLIDHVWGSRRIPSEAMPEEVLDITDARWMEMRNLKAIREGRISLSNALTSYFYHFVPERGLNRLMVFHQGHAGDFIASIDFIRGFVEQGFDVIALAMPLLWRNRVAGNFVETEKFGPILVPPDLPNATDFHKYVNILSSEEVTAERIFLEPPVVALNYALSRQDFDFVGMAGLSGGGWTTTLVAAVDPRIQSSFQIAGSLPFYLRAVRPARDMGDFEQYGLPLYRIANYLELYLLAAAGNGRVHVQILNEHDPCCFDQPLAARYAGVLAGVMEQEEIPGAFEFILDDTHESHGVSRFAAEQILSISLNQVPAESNVR
jgi:hypothetical protein